MTSQEQVRQRCQHNDFAAVLGQATQTGFLEPELVFDHSERVLDLGADMCLGRFDQTLQPAIGGIREGSALAWPHCNPELCCSASHLRPFGDAMVTSVAVHHLLITM